MRNLDSDPESGGSADARQLARHAQAPELPEGLAQQLLEQMAWLRRLAGALIGDAERAEDLVQDTLVLALERPPREVGALKGWLRRVLLNRHREVLREGSSRQGRERRGARPEALEAADELVGRVQLQQRLAERLLGLEEPLRNALLLRYVEDLSPRKIAARLGIPVATVKSRLARGLARLREQLDDEHGGNRALWAAALVPLAPEVGTATTLGLGGLGMGMKLWIAAAGVVLATAWLWPRQERGAAVLQEQVAAQPGRALADSAGASQESEEAALGQQPSRNSASGATNTVQPAELKSYLVQGQTIDVEGRGFAGVQVRLAGQEAGASSGVGGYFELQSASPTGRLEAADQRYVALGTSAWRAEQKSQAILIMAPAVEIAGRVVDRWGRGIAGARLSLDGPQSIALPAGVSLTDTYLNGWSAEADREGRFDLGRLPYREGFQLLASQSGYEPARVALPSLTTSELLILLEAPAPPPGQALAGRVLRPNGQPASAALVALGANSTKVDADGYFIFDLSRSGAGERLSAIEAGFLPVYKQRLASPSADSTGWPAFVELVLELEALSISGRVVNADGTPRPEVRLWLAQPERFASVGRVPVSIEALAAGAQPPPEAIESLALLDDGETYESAQPAMAPSALVSWVISDQNGKFEIPGLQPRGYVLNVADRQLTWGTITDEIQAGSRDVTIVANLSTCYELVQGRVVTSRGDPVPGVSITPWVMATRQVVTEGAQTSDISRFFQANPLISDQAGRFELSSVPRRELNFFVFGEGILPAFASSDEIEDPADFRIEVAARVSFEFTAVPGAEAPDALRLSDKDGQPLDFYALRADGYSNFAVYPLSDGMSGLLSLTTEARTLHVLRGEVELGQIPLDPRPGQPVSLGW